MRKMTGWVLGLICVFALVGCAGGSNAVKKADEWVQKNVW